MTTGLCATSMSGARRDVVRLMQQEAHRGVSLRKERRRLWKRSFQSRQRLARVSVCITVQVLDKGLLERIGALQNTFTCLVSLYLPTLL